MEPKSMPKPSKRYPKSIPKNTQEKTSEMSCFSRTISLIFLSKIHKNTMQKNMKKTITNKHEIWYQMASKMEPESMLELIKNQYKNWYRKKEGKS